LLSPWSDPVTVRTFAGIDLVIETDFAQPLIAGVSVGQAQESDFARAIFARLTSPWSDPITVRTFAQIDQANETDTAQPLGGNQPFAVGIAIEIDTIIGPLIFILTPIATDLDETPAVSVETFGRARSSVGGRGATSSNGHRSSRSRETSGSARSRK
jgi:hypothetical protein